MTETVADVGSLEKTIKRVASPARSGRRRSVSWWPPRGPTEGLIGPAGLLGLQTKTGLETALEEELTEHLGYDKHAVEGCSGADSPQRHAVQDGPVDAVGRVEIDAPQNRDVTLHSRDREKRQPPG